jgi:hypothetical protein
LADEAQLPVLMAPPDVPAISREQSPIYTILDMAREIRQAEIITDLAQYTYDPEEGAVETLHKFAIVLSQDCDLLWDYEAAAKSEPAELNGVLVYELETAEDARTKINGRDIWKRMRQNKDERYHFLELVPATLDLLGQGLPDMMIDFKRCFTLPAKEIYRQTKIDGGARRRCRLEMPYREHLQARAAFYLQRVTLLLSHRPSADV